MPRNKKPQRGRWMQDMKKTAKDVNGIILRTGDIVRVLGVPDYSSWSTDQRKMSVHVFRYLVGRYKRIDGFNVCGMAELNFRFRVRGRMESHFVAIEPELLRKKRNRGNSRSSSG